MSLPFEAQQDTFIHLSPLPKASESGYRLGVDEAGRGPVLGPMVYAVCFHEIGREEEFNLLGLDDSKVLSAQQRENLFDQIHSHSDYIGYAIHSLSPAYISNSMLGREKYNLNAMAHDTTVGLIRKVIDAGINVKEIYVDTVGPPDKYALKLRSKFPYIKIEVAKKADSLYPCVSAASICAKVTRDRVLKEWQFESGFKGGLSDFGSGYTSDPYTTKWLKETLDPVFGWPDIIRFSWSTSERLLEDNGVKVTWPESENTKKNFKRMLKSTVQAALGEPVNAIQQSNYFKNMGISAVEEL